MGKIQSSGSNIRPLTFWPTNSNKNFEKLKFLSLKKNDYAVKLS